MVNNLLKLFSSEQLILFYVSNNGEVHGINIKEWLEIEFEKNCLYFTTVEWVI